MVDRGWQGFVQNPGGEKGKSALQQPISEAAMQETGEFTDPGTPIVMDGE